MRRPMWLGRAPRQGMSTGYQQRLSGNTRRARERRRRVTVAIIRRSSAATAMLVIWIIVSSILAIARRIERAATGVHSRRRLVVFRRTNSASTICLAMSWIGLKIAGTPTIAARLLMARRGTLETVVGALCVAGPGPLVSASSARLAAAGSPRSFGTPPLGSAWPEHSSYILYQ